MYEKRKYPRHDIALQCYVEQFSEDSEKIMSKVVDQSFGGMRVVNDYRYYPGDTLRIAIDADGYDMQLFGQYSCTGVVRWCEEQKGYYGGMYAAGIELTGQMYRPNEKDYVYESDGSMKPENG